MRVPVAIVPAVENDEVDLLFMIDDSPGAIEYEGYLTNKFAVLSNRLGVRRYPDVHIGVVTSDLGSSAAGDATPAPGIGTGAGMCSGNGKNGNLQNPGTVVQGTFITDTLNSNGTRTSNYAGTIFDAFTSLASVGGAGCGFEQHQEAVHRALDSNPANAGFLRPEANLAVVIVGDEDDCSLEHASLLSTDTTTLGPLQSFRCTHYGVTCADGGTTPDDMNTPGTKGRCHSNESGDYLTKVADEAAFLESLKPDPHMVMVGEIVGNPEPVDVELRPPPGGGSPIPALTHSCQYTDQSNQTVVADPAVRDVELANQFDRHAVGTICSTDLTDPLTEIGRQIDGMTGSPCLLQDVAMPADCTVTDDNGPVADYQLVEDPTMCPDGQHLRIERAGTAAGSTIVECSLP